jgi:hypothetical protein
VPLSCKNSDASQIRTLVDPCRLSVARMSFTVVTGITFPFPLFTYNLRSFEESDKKILLSEEHEFKGIVQLTVHTVHG